MVGFLFDVGGVHRVRVETRGSMSGDPSRGPVVRESHAPSTRYRAIEYSSAPALPNKELLTFDLLETTSATTPEMT